LKEVKVTQTISRDDFSGAEAEFNVLIVGSGPAGSTYARTIGDAQPSARILMVEVGPAVGGLRGNHTFNMTGSDRTAAQLLTQGSDAGIDRAVAFADLTSGVDPSVDLRQTILPGLFFLDHRPQLTDGEVGLPAASMASGVGGMGIHWATSCPRPHQSERIPFLPEDELDQALEHAEQLLGVTTLHHAHGALGAIHQAMAAEFDAPGLTPVGYLPGARQLEGDTPVFSGTNVILGELEQTVPGFELRPETLARRILLEHNTAVGAELQDRRNGRIYQVRATHVIVCADGLRTPQVLFASGIRPPALGHYLNEHFFTSSFIMLNDEFDSANYPAPRESLGSVLIPFSDARPMEGCVIPLASSPYKLLFVDQGLTISNFSMLAWYAAKDIQYRDAVEFSETETDFYGMPEMSIRYTHTDKDLTTIEAMLENANRSATRIGTPTETPTLAAGGSSLHYQGTVRMGPTDDGTSVCDPYLRVWGVNNLRIGGNGVIPTATAANPTLTTVALAWRAATQLARELTGANRIAGATAP
jgi:choline dehydrogenase-like flavoprotein